MIKQTRDENKEKYQLGDYLLIQYQIPQSYILRIVWEPVRRMTCLVSEVQELQNSTLKETQLKGRFFCPIKR